MLFLSYTSKLLYFFRYRFNHFLQAATKWLGNLGENKRVLFNFLKKLLNKTCFLSFFAQEKAEQ